MSLKVRKSKVDAIRQAAKPMAPLTDDERVFLEDHITKGGKYYCAKSNRDGAQNC
jgi:hypothetical protein